MSSSTGAALCCTSPRLENVDGWRLAGLVPALAGKCSLNASGLTEIRWTIVLGGCAPAQARGERVRARARRRRWRARRPPYGGNRPRSAFGLSDFCAVFQAVGASNSWITNAENISLGRQRLSRTSGFEVGKTLPSGLQKQAQQQRLSACLSPNMYPSSRPRPHKRRRP
jgi:hypothetical protein